MPEEEIDNKYRNYYERWRPLLPPPSPKTYIKGSSEKVIVRCVICKHSRLVPQEEVPAYDVYCRDCEISARIPFKDEEKDEKPSSQEIPYFFTDEARDAAVRDIQAEYHRRSSSDDDGERKSSLRLSSRRNVKSYKIPSWREMQTREYSTVKDRRGPALTPGIPQSPVSSSSVYTFERGSFKNLEDIHPAYRNSYSTSIGTGQAESNPHCEVSKKSNPAPQRRRNSEETLALSLRKHRGERR
jgi:hypothetical protein